jgi:hypothetical protein
METSCMQTHVMAYSATQYTQMQHNTHSCMQLGSRRAPGFISSRFFIAKLFFGEVR